MSYFAKVTDGIVQEVISADQSYIDTLPDAINWIQTSYNTHGGIHYGQDGKPDGGIALRGNYAGIGYIYDAVNDVFYEPQIYPSWTISAPTWIWQPPVPYPPYDPKIVGPQPSYYWDETTQSWILV